MLPNRASVPPVNSTAETSGGTHGLLMHKFSFRPLSKGLTEANTKKANQIQSSFCLTLHPSAYQCFRGRKQYHTNTGVILCFLFSFLTKSSSKSSSIRLVCILKGKIYCFRKTVTLDTLGLYICIRISFLSKFSPSVTCYNHLIQTAIQVKKKRSNLLTSRHTTLLVTQHCAAFSCCSLCSFMSVFYTPLSQF